MLLTLFWAVSLVKNRHEREMKRARKRLPSDHKYELFDEGNAMEFFIV